MKEDLMQSWVVGMVATVSSILASSGFWAWIVKRDSNKSATNRLILGLAYEKITTLGLHYIERGWITKDEFEDFRKYLFEPYKELGGNGVGERIMAEVSQLPLRAHRKYSEIVQENRTQEGARTQ